MASPATPEASLSSEMGATRVRFAVGDAEIIVRVAGNPSGRDVVSMLPLTLEFEDLAGQEKISYLPRKLITKGSVGGPFANRDLIYFIPRGNLGFFYNAERRDKSYDNQVALIGTVETGFNLLDKLESGSVRVDVIP